MSKLFDQIDALKAQYPDHLLLTRLGDFYEAFGEDAQTLAAVCKLTLTVRRVGPAGGRVMAGIPHFTADKYIARLVEAGHKVAVAEASGGGPIDGLIPRHIDRIEE